ncbi:hypothetical protein CKO19_16420 [Rhodovulum adriaticum]|nr:hypothetical protein [Rhodovulum adriaticum]
MGETLELVAWNAASLRLLQLVAQDELHTDVEGVALFLRLLAGSQDRFPPLNDRCEGKRLTVLQSADVAQQDVTKLAGGKKMARTRPSCDRLKKRFAIPRVRKTYQIGRCNHLEHPTFAGVARLPEVRMSSFSVFLWFTLGQQAFGHQVENPEIQLV